MKLIRCVVQPYHVDEVVDAVKALGEIQGLTVTSGVGWSERQQVHRRVYRGCEYEVRVHPELIIDVTAPDHVVDDVVKIVVDRCSIGQAGDGARILVLPVEDWHEVRARPRRTA